MLPVAERYKQVLEHSGEHRKQLRHYMATPSAHYDEEYISLCEEDHRLVQKYLLGDSDAADILYHHAYWPAMGKAREANRDGLFSYEDLQDIVNEALFRCFYKCEQYMPITRFSSWARGFVHFTALEARRKHYSTRKKELAFMYDHVGIETIDPETYVILKEREFCFRLAFDPLSDLQRQLVLWDAFGVYTQAETRKKQACAEAKWKSKRSGLSVPFIADTWPHIMGQRLFMIDITENGCDPSFSIYGR